MLIPYATHDAAGPFCGFLPAYEPVYAMGLPFPFYVIHRHRSGARKARRLLRREQQRNFQRFAAREGESERSLRQFMRPRGWLRLTWQRDA